MWTPDRLDFDIIRELAGSPSQWNIKKSYTSVAKKLRVDEETVRNRLRRMKQEGYLLGWRLMPNPWLIGRRASLLLMEFEDSNAKERAVTQLLHTDGVVIIAKFYGKTMLLTLFHEDAEEGLVKEVQAITSLCGGKLVTSWEMRFPQNAQKLATIDWEIMQLLMANPERKLSEVARELRISTRTAKRRVNNMMNSYAFFLIPVVSLRKIGGVPCQLIVECAEAKKPAIDKAVISKFDRIIFRDTASNTHSVFGITSANITEGEEVSKWIQEQPGVRSVKLNIVEEPIHAYGWLEKQVETRTLRGTTRR